MQRAFRLIVITILLAMFAPFGGGSERVEAGRQDEPSTSEVGAGPPGDRAFTLVGRSEYGEDSVLLYGYLSSVIGLDRARLFTDPTALSAATARLTYAGKIAIADRAERDGVIEVTGEGTFNIFLRENGGADFADPASFSGGEVIAEMTIQLRDAIQSAPPAPDVVVGVAEIEQTEAWPFVLDAASYRFGHLNARQRLRVVGAAASVDDATLRMSVTGVAVVTYRDPNPAGSIAPTPEPATGECAGIERWLTEASARIAEARRFTSEVAPDATIASLDAEQLRDLAASVETLATAQREASPPAIGVETNRLIVTALSTSARGLRQLAEAVATEDETAFAGGQRTLASGAELVARADGELIAAATECGIEG